MTDKKKFMQGGMETVYGDINADDSRNSRAEELLFQAWDVAGYHGQAGADFYPRTARETEEMDCLLKQAEAAVEDTSDNELMEALYETRSVVDWSRQRHWTFAWWVVICVAIMGAYYLFSVGGDEDLVKQRQAMSDEQVRQDLDAYIANLQKNSAQYQDTLACDTISQKKRERYEEYLKSNEERLEELQAYDVAGYREHLVDMAKARASNTYWAGIWCYIWIALYLFACRPKGYMITKRRRETAVASGAKKVLFAIAGALVGAAASLKVTTTVTTWSDGSKTKEDDSMIITFMRFGFIAVAILIVLWAARIIIVIATLLALLRNFEWRKVIADPKKAVREFK